MSYHKDGQCGPQDCEFYSYGESDSLKILRKFRNIYENEMHKIDSKGGPDCLQAKVNFQEQWIQDLTEQNEMMAKTVEKLECEATARVKMLEAKLKSNAECICEVMQRYSQLNDSLNLDEPFQKIFYVENDIKNLLEFIRRVREDHCWSIDGLKFYDITHCDLFGDQQFCTTICPSTREKDETCVKKKEALEKHIEELSSLREVTENKNEELEHLKGMQIGDEVTKMQNQKDEILPTPIEDKEEQYYQTDIKAEEMQTMLGNCQKRADNLQKAVDYYINSVTLLEAAEEKAKMQIEEQKLTICTLQEALLDVKRELDEFKRNNNEEIQQYQHMLEILCSTIVELEEKKLNLCGEVSKITTTYKALFDVNFELEVKHITALQDLSLAETNLMKYQKKLRQVEGDLCFLKTDLEKVQVEKRALEEQVTGYQFEKKVLSERILIVEDNLIVSKKSYEDETARLIDAVACQQSINDKLSTKLYTTEQNLLLEKQMGQQHIEELARLVYEKDVELGNYARSLEEVKNRLDESLQQNQLLQEEICMLNCKVVQMENTMKIYEEDHVHHLQNNEACQSLVVIWEEKLRGLKQALDQKNEELNKLKAQYCTTYDILLASQKEIVELKDDLKQGQQTVFQLNKSLSELTTGNSKLMDELSVLKENIEETTKKLTGKEKEVVNYTQVVRDLKNNLINLNHALLQAEKDNGNSGEVLTHQLRKDEITSCQCDSESFTALEDDVARLLEALQKLLLGKESLIQNLREAVEKHNQSISEKSEKEFRYEEEIEELTNKLQRSKQEERHLKCNVKKLQYDVNTLQKELRNRDDLIELLRDSLEQVKSKSSKQESISEEKMSALKNEINVSQQKQNSLAQEKEKLLEQLPITQQRASELEEKNILMKEQLQGYVMEIDSLQQDKERMARKNDQLHQDIQKLQNSLVNVKKQNRYNMEALQRELSEVRDNRDDISGESRHIIENVRLWLVEQKSINLQASAKLKNYVDIIEDLQYEKSLLSQQLHEQLAKDGIDIPDSVSPPCHRRMCQPPRDNRRKSPCRYTNSMEEDEELPRYFRQCMPIRCPSQRSLGSQGSSAGEELGCDPCRVRCYGLSDWTSSSLMGSEVGDIIDDYDDEEFCLSRVQTMTEELNKTNRFWKAKMRNAEYCVTKDDKNNISKPSSIV